MCVPIKVMREEAVALLDEAVPVKQLLVRLVLVPRPGGRHVVPISRSNLFPVLDSTHLLVHARPADVKQPQAGHIRTSQVTMSCQVTPAANASCC